MTKADKFRRVKPDITPYLFHFTKGDNAKTELGQILEEQKLKTEKKDYICFTSSPLTSLHRFFQTKVNRTNSPMYAPFGIGFSRNIMYEKYGARNVIYGTENEREKIEKNIPELLWRWENLDIESHDYEWLREWRVKGTEFDFSDFDKNEIIIVADTKDSLNKLAVNWDWDVEYEHEIRASYPYVVKATDNKRQWKGFALEDIKNYEDDHKLSGATSNQEIGETIKKKIEIKKCIKVTKA